jgi:tRNA A37 methylthiotransferase MiaB
LEKNEKLVGKKVFCLVSEKATNGFNARTNEYKPVFLKKGFGHFVKTKLVSAKPHFFVGDFVELLD